MMGRSKRRERKGEERRKNGKKVAYLSVDHINALKNDNFVLTKSFRRGCVIYLYVLKKYIETLFQLPHTKKLEMVWLVWIILQNSLHGWH